MDRNAAMSRSHVCLQPRQHCLRDLFACGQPPEPQGTAALLCTLRSSGHPETTQHSVRGGWLAFAGRGSHPADPYARFQPSLHDILLAQACLAHAHFGIERSDWILLTSNKGLLQRIRHLAREPTRQSPVVWTDDHSNLFRLLSW